MLRGERMLIISERLNGLFRSVGKAIDRRDEEFIQRLALEQVEAGSDALDVNTGPGREDAPRVMEWLVNTIQEVTDVRLSIDSPDPDVIEAGLKVVKNKPIINSTTAEKKKMSRLFPLANEYDADIICLTMDEKGVPNDAESRAELAMVMLTTGMEHGLEPDRIYLDPLILPISASQDQGPKVLQALTMFRSLMDPPPKTVVGLSNISNGAKERSLLNRAYLAMLMAHGLDAAILDPTDKELMKILKSCQILLNQKLYAHDYLRA